MSASSEDRDDGGFVTFTSSLEDGEPLVNGEAAALNYVLWDPTAQAYCAEKVGIGPNVEAGS